MLSFTQSTCLHTLKDGRQIHRNCWHFFNLHLSANVQYKSRKKTLNKNLYVYEISTPLCLSWQCFSKNWNSSAAKDIFQRGANLDPKCWVRTNIQISIYTSSSRAEHMNNGPKKGRNSENHHHNLKIGRDRGWSTWESKIDSSI